MFSTVQSASRRTIHSFSSQRIIVTRLSAPVIAFKQERCFRISQALLGDVHTVKTPAFAESVSSGDMKWMKEVGDFVSVDEIIGEVETDKTAVPVNSPVSGVIKSFLVDDGVSVEGNQGVAEIEEGDVPSESNKAQDESKEETNVEPAPPTQSDPVEEPKPVSKQPLTKTPTDKIKPVSVTAAPDSQIVGGFSRVETRVKMNRMRLKIAKRLKEAQNTAAMLTTFNEIDMSNALELRSKNKDAFLKRHDLKLSLMSAFVKASVYALKDSSLVNAVIDENTNDIVYRDYIDISIAVASPKGLVVPVLRNCNDMNYAEIEKGIAELAGKARRNELAIEDMDGGTFTISNGGVFGSLFGTPILNPPQSAILGMHAINDRPVAIDGKVEIRPMMYVALTYDHRLLDGREAVQFLKKIKTAVEDPRMMLLDL